MSAAVLSVGMYVTMTGGVAGRIVDRKVEQGTLWWVIKTKTGTIYRARSSKLSAR